MYKTKKSRVQPNNLFQHFKELDKIFASQTFGVEYITKCTLLQNLTRAGGVNARFLFDRLFCKLCIKCEFQWKINQELYRKGGQIREIFNIQGIKT